MRKGPSHKKGEAGTSPFGLLLHWTLRLFPAKPPVSDYGATTKDAKHHAHRFRNRLNLLQATDAHIVKSEVVGSGHRIDRVDASERIYGIDDAELEHGTGILLGVVEDGVRNRDGANRSPETGAVQWV